MSSLVEPDSFLQVKREDYELAIAKCNVTDKMVRESIENINHWYEMQLHLPEGGISDKRLFRLLLASNFSLEKTKQKIDNIFTARNLWPEIVGNRDPWSKSLKAVTKHGQGVILPKRLDDMCRVFVLTFQSEDLTNYNVWDVIKLALMVYEYRISSDVSLGDHYILDLKDIKFDHIKQLTPALMQKTLFVLQNCFGAKIKGIHFLNTPTYAEYIIAMLKAALSKKIARRVHIHKDQESLHKMFPKAILPSNLGGDEKSTVDLADDLYARLARPEMREWFLKEDQLKSDESRRIEVKNNMSEGLLGLQGSFRTIEID